MPQLVYASLAHVQASRGESEPASERKEWILTGKMYIAECEAQDLSNVDEHKTNTGPATLSQQQEMHSM